MVAYSLLKEFALSLAPFQKMFCLILPKAAV